jgi:thiamine-monophosphate kinase
MTESQHRPSRLQEREIISRIRRQSSAGQESLLAGIGDDCAVFRTGLNRLNLVTTDTLVQGVHFDLSWHPADKLGRKAAAVNISDIAAMGGIPRFALLSLALPADLPGQWLDGFLSGFLGLLAEYAVVLIGGDTVGSSQGIVLSVTVLGEAAEGLVLARSGARSGDLVMVSGFLGEAAAGLDLCRLGLGKESRWQPLVSAHLDPVPQVGLGRELAASGLVHAMMDISDGLATDLAHICAESRVGAVVEGAALPLSPLLQEAAVVCGHSALDWALSGGEDYQLLFTVPPENVAELQRHIRERSGRQLYVVGRIVAGGGVLLEEGGTVREISYRGYEHFRDSE